MNVTVYSIMTAIICFNLFIVLFSVLREKLDVYTGFNLYPLVCIIIATMFRMLVPIELSLTREINIDVVLPSIQMFLQADLHSFLPISRFAFLVIILSFVSVLLLLRLVRVLLGESHRLQRLQPTSNSRLIALMEEVISKTKVRVPYILVTFPEIKSPYICGLRTLTFDKYGIAFFVLLG